MKFFSLILTFVSIFVLGQNSIDINNINKNVQNSKSLFFYERLIFKFNFNPNDLSSEEMKHLYYGSNKNPYGKKNDEVLTQLDEIQKSKNCSHIINETHKILNVYPTILKGYVMCLDCYAQENKTENKNFAQRLIQLRKLFNTIMENGKSTPESKDFKVMSVSDEYIILNLLGIKIRDFKRTSIQKEEGYLDIWEDKHNNKISFLVFNEL